jgi:parvulin-like peptidyl-prolyl isomerase
MKRWLLHALALWIALPAASAQDPADSRVVASAKGWSITAQQFEQFLNLLPDQPHEYFVAHRREFLDQLVRIWVMAGEARAQGFDQTPKFKATVDFYSNNMLAGELHNRQVTGSVTATDEAVKAYYEANKSDFTKVRLSHILIPNSDSPLVREQRITGAMPPAEAKRGIEEALAKLRGGARFEEVAREYSKDRESAAKGGDLGYVSRGQMPASVEAAAFVLKEGAFSDIVESPFGFHILYVSELNVMPLAEATLQIRQKLDAAQFDEQLKAKIREAEVTIDEAFFKK